ncbi:unnamed protein product [Sphenostylis stenocarpa]|uniref:Uncharacterized protein n=1 Tax=Sphenostylis stenocarpa TaxID=92480 RepID=A0AA86SG72_9FABA|nr:unnamed protein product [Sphenostylis stenocarpa]
MSPWKTAAIKVATLNMKMEMKVVGYDGRKTRRLLCGLILFTHSSASTTTLVVHATVDYHHPHHHEASWQPLPPTRTASQLACQGQTLGQGI